MTLGELMNSPIEKLATWYSAQCDGDWEHGHGFKITTIDNPGVAVDIDLCGTDLELIPYTEKKEDYNSKDNWMICRRTDEKFEGRGAASKLENIISEFISWTEKK